MRRREFIALLSSMATAWPTAARAQQPERLKRIGYVVGLGDDAETQARLMAFRKGLEALGWIEGRNIEIVARFGAADPDRNRSYVEELIGLVPDVIVSSNALTTSTLIKEAHTLPIVFPMASDPVAQGFAASLAHPGGNVTGFTTFEPAMAGKWLELLREVAPGLTRVAALIDPQYPSTPLYNRALEAAAPTQRVQLTLAPVRSDAEIEQAIDAFARQPRGGLLVPPAPSIENRRSLIFKLAARHRLPTVYPYRYMAVESGLMSYGPDILDLFRRAASYADRILKGAKPSDLPIQQPTKFELVINLKTAKALGIAIPPLLLARADEVIE